MRRLHPVISLCYQAAGGAFSSPSNLASWLGSKLYLPALRR